MRIDRRSKPVRASSNPTANAYLDAVASGYGHMASFDGGEPDLAREWLREQGIRHFVSRDVFAFKTRRDAARFFDRFSDVAKRR